MLRKSAWRSFGWCMAAMFLCGFISAQKSKKPISADVYYKRGLATMKIGNCKEAVKDFSQAIKLNHENAEFFNQRGVCRYKISDVQKAVEDFGKAIELKPDFAEAYINRAKVLSNFFVSGDGYTITRKMALVDLNKAVETNPNNADVYFARARFILLTNEKSDKEAQAKVLKDFNRAIQLNPRFAEAFVGRAEFYYEVSFYNEIKELEKAIADSTKSIELNPRNSKGFEVRADCYSALKKYEQAIADYTTALKFQPEDLVQVLWSRANAYSQIGKTRQAEIDRRESERLGKLAWAKKKLEKRELEFSNLQIISSGIYELIGYSLFDSYITVSRKEFEPTDSYIEEIERLTKILQANPQFAEGFFERGNKYLTILEYDKAIADYSQAIKLDPQDYHSFNNRGIVCAKTGNYERAIADFARVLSINPQQHSSLYNFGLVLLNKGLFQQSINILTSYIKQEPNNIKSYQLRAKAYRKLGKIAEAEADEQMAKRLEDDMLDVLDY